MAARRQKKAPYSLVNKSYRRLLSDFFHAKATSLLLSWAITLFTGSAFIVIISVGLLFSYRSITNSTFFAVQKIQVSGTVRLEQEDVLNLAHLKNGDNSLAVNISDIEYNLLRSPWVKNVSVKRQLPGDLAITIEEREPRYWMRQENRIVYADEKGNPIDYVGTYKFASLPFLSVDDGTEHLLQRLPQLVAELDSSRLPVSSHNAAWIKLSLSGGITLFLESEDILLSIGVDNWASNLRHLVATIDDLKRRGEFTSVRGIKAEDRNVWVSTGTTSNPAS
ncbi:cell division protein FtsQ/DivIB [Halodesulfovibrio marinisediminis]|uniref:Cell division protein FtsQ n=1 Tax=Halodesulfovibrio marinisediminis DSM 17456 TaxID=1121457 RepID=A0A1N6HJF6_9BACT|nr:FtsQ-type POTRA domain-containing protein [Halodesulfovibrio marinisediminis]SIO19866.1 cell division protein FtsQ [Halodesulfovibrio marinisediminis DSM 17456]